MNVAVNKPSVEVSPIPPAGEMGATERIARYVVETDFSTAPPSLTAEVTRAIVDLFAAAVAARNDEGFIILHQVVSEDMRPGPCMVIPTGETTSPLHAALLNGGAGHALDFDDVSDTLYGHPTVTILPPLLAMAESRELSGKALIEAYSIGFDVAVAISLALPVWPHFNRGWHATASVGVMSATAALCRLLGLTVDQTRHALGIAASNVCSSRQNFGTMTKPLHPGISSQSAVLAARLAERGFTADPDQLEKPLGYFAVFGTDSDLSALSESLSSPFALLRDGLSFKKFSCCYNTHRTVDAALAISAAIPPEERGKIDKVVVTLQPTAINALIHHRPTTGLQGKFSIEFVIAAGLIDGELPLMSFTDEVVMRQSVQDLIRKIEVRESPTPPVGPAEWEFAYSVLEVSCGGRSYVERVDIPKGDCRNPLSDTELDEKFLKSVEFAKVDWNGGARLAALRDIANRSTISGIWRD